MERRAYQLWQDFTRGLLVEASHTAFQDAPLP